MVELFSRPDADREVRYYEDMGDGRDIAYYADPRMRIEYRNYRTGESAIAYTNAWTYEDIRAALYAIERQRLIRILCNIAGKRAETTKSGQIPECPLDAL